jgi:hypothetical protein
MPMGRSLRVVATATNERRLSDEQLGEVLELVRGADSVELKLTVPESDQRGTVAALEVDPLEAQIRQVYFFDTPELALDKAGVVVRPRRIQGKGSDSVVKLRPVVPAELPDELRESPNMVVEVDAMPGGFVCSATLKDKLGPKQVRATILGEKPFRKLFSKEQRQFFTANAPEGVELDDLSVLGPVFVLKLKWTPEDFGARGRALALSGRLADHRALHEVRPRPDHAGRGRGTRLPGREGRRSLRRAADEDEDGARVLRERADAVNRLGAAC